MALSEANVEIKDVILVFGHPEVLDTKLATIEPEGGSLILLDAFRKNDAVNTGVIRVNSNLLQKSA